MHYQPLNVQPAYPISAVYQETAPQPSSPWVMPGIYTAKLTVNGKVYKQSFSIMMDPRVETSQSALQQQHDLSVICYNDEKDAMDIVKQIHSLQVVLNDRLAKATTNPQNRNSDLQELLECEKDISSVRNSLAGLQGILQEADAQPTSQCIAQVKAKNEEFRQLVIKFGSVATRIATPKTKN
jgi:hypothetical protein